MGQTDLEAGENLLEVAGELHQLMARPWGSGLTSSERWN